MKQKKKSKKEIEKEKKDNKEENIDFLRYLKEVEKFPLEMESLRTSIESNKSTIRLANESVSHFQNTRADNRRTLWATLGVSLLTLIILIVQTFSVNKTELEKPIELETSQVQQILKAQEVNNLTLLKALERNNLILTTQVDSLKSELQRLNKTLISIRNKK